MYSVHAPGATASFGKALWSRGWSLWNKTHQRQILRGNRLSGKEETSYLKDGHRMAPCFVFKAAETFHGTSRCEKSLRSCYKNMGIHGKWENKQRICSSSICWSPRVRRGFMRGIWYRSLALHKPNEFRTALFVNHVMSTHGFCGAHSWEVPRVANASLAKTWRNSWCAHRVATVRDCYNKAMTGTYCSEPLTTALIMVSSFPFDTVQFQFGFLFFRLNIVIRISIPFVT